MSETVVLSDEQFVREHWSDRLFDNGLHLYEGARSFHLRLGQRKFDFTQKTKQECWSAARAFTEDRLEQIRQVEEELSLLYGQRASLGEWIAHKLLDLEFNQIDAQEVPIRVRQLHRTERIIARIETTRDDLKRSMRWPGSAGEGEI